MDIPFFDLTVDSSIKVSIIINRSRNLSFSYGAEKFENACVMLQKIMEYLNTIRRHPRRIIMKFERDKGNF